MNQLQTVAVRQLSTQHEQITTALQGLSLEIQKTAVWAVYKDLMHEGLHIIHKMNPALSVTIDDVYDIAQLTRILWQLDASRQERSTCYLCTKALPGEADDLCVCLGSTWEFDLCPNGWTREHLDYFIQQYGGNYTGIAYYCRNPACKFGRLYRWSLNTISKCMAPLASGAVWHAPKNRLCAVCYKTHNGDRRSTRPPRPSQPPVRLPVSELADRMGITIEVES